MLSWRLGGDPLLAASRRRFWCYKLAVPSPTDRPFPIVVLGATGYTGRLVAAELARRGARFALAGRSRSKLEALARTLPAPPPIVIADTGDEKSLRAMAAQARVVLSCAGPFALMGRPVVEAALAERAHYCDITGEVGFMRWTFERGPEARAAGVVLCNAVGFDVVPTDLCVALASRGLAGVRSVEIAFALRRGKISQGTLRSVLSMAKLDWTTTRGGATVQESPNPGDAGVARFARVDRAQSLAGRSMEIDFPAPIGRRRVVSAPFGDMVTAPATSGASEIHTFIGFRWPRLARAGAPLARVFFALGGARLGERLVTLAPEGPTAAERDGALFGIWARATGADGRVQVATATGKDPYGLTAVTASFAAMQLAKDDYAKSGALSPMQAVSPDAWQAHLLEAGFLRVA